MKPQNTQLYIVLQIKAERNEMIREEEEQLQDYKALDATSTLNVAS